MRPGLVSLQATERFTGFLTKPKETVKGERFRFKVHPDDTATRFVGEFDVDADSGSGCSEVG